MSLMVFVKMHHWSESIQCIMRSMFIIFFSILRNSYRIALIELANKLGFS